MRRGNERDVKLGREGSTPPELASNVFGRGGESHSWRGHGSLVYSGCQGYTSIRLVMSNPAACATRLK